GHTAGIETVSLSGNHSKVVTAGQDGVARVWDTRTGRLLATLPGKDGWLIDAELDPRGERVVTAGRNGTARLFTATGELLHELRTRGAEAQAGLWKATFNRDGSLIGLGDWNSGRVTLFAASTGRLVRAIDTHEAHVILVAFSPDGKRLATAH